MPACSVTGVIFGDEGKGKVTDVIAEEADLVVRYMGGNNAGHTVVIAGKEYVTHVFPTGVLQGKQCAIAAGVVLDPRQLIKEMDEFEGYGMDINLTIDPRTHIIMPYHNILDGAREKLRKKHGGVKIGTTGRGIGPVHEDRSNRLGIRFFDLIDKKRLEDKLDIVYPEKAFLLRRFYDARVPHKKRILEQYTELGERLKPYFGDVSQEVIDALKADKNVLFEGAQGTLLDIMYGNYPRVTSSHPMTGSIYTNVGLPPFPIYNIGVLKAYMTRVGYGPLVTGLDNGDGPVNEEESQPEAIQIRAKGKEVGATTGRKRRVGWLDLVAAGYSCRLNGFDEIALTKLDILEGLDTKIATAYEHVDADGWTGEGFKAWDLEHLNQCIPHYTSFIKFDNLVDEDGKITKAARSYIDFISEFIDIPVKFISTGPGRSEYVFIAGKHWWSK